MNRDYYLTSEYAKEAMRKGYADADGCSVAVIGEFKKVNGQVVPSIVRSMERIRYFTREDFKAYCETSHPNAEDLIIAVI